MHLSQTKWTKRSSLGKKAIGDLSHRGEPKFISFPNSHDPKQVDRFKSRALKRYENSNCMTKVFQILAGRFQHGEEKFRCAFEAICVICQCKLETELPLHDVLIDAVINADALAGPVWDDSSDSSNSSETVDDENC